MTELGTAAPIQCPHCGKRFGSEQARGQHCQAKHPGMKFSGKKHSRPPRKQRQDDGDESMAEMFIRGELNRAMGIRNPEWLEDMLP